ncbi:hypothetical protein [Acidipropionibacterium timonense]|uniref:hypothetical protein n=1 Tax=Acidipropionibacterium timonense TaxID=2161818 RepID=UPI00102F4CFA|nr:hypothetical protein [Acidipropionibacterium timonense]
MRPRVLAALTACLIGLTGCTTAARPAASQASSIGAATTPTPSLVARGVATSTMPSGLDRAGQTAARLVIVANAADTRLDHTLAGAWTRAAVTLPAITRRQLDPSGAGTGGWWWTRDMTGHDGWISVNVTNVTGGQPQAPGAPAGTGRTVIFTLDYHRSDIPVQHDRQPHSWTMHTGPNGTITSITMNS